MSSLFKPSEIFAFNIFSRIILSEIKLKMFNEDFTALAETRLLDSSLGINHFENYSIFLEINKSLKPLFIPLKILYAFLSGISINSTNAKIERINIKNILLYILK